MKIGIDIDNTITDTLPLLKKYCEEYNSNVVKRNLEINPYGFSTSNLFDWTKDEEMNFCSKYLEEVVLSAKIKSQAKEIIKKLKDEKNYIYIITARKEPYFKDPYKMTKKYLDENNILYDELIVGCDNKYDFCRKNKIDVMIDDEPQNINSISKMIPVIVFSGVQNQMCNGNNIIRVNSWNEVYEYLKNYYIKD